MGHGSVREHLLCIEKDPDILLSLCCSVISGSRCWERPWGLAARANVSALDGPMVSLDIWPV